jgi:acyl carrier protein
MGSAIVTRDELLAEITEILEEDVGSVRIDQELAGLDAWDSMSALSIIALFDKKLSKAVTADEMKGVRTVADIIKLSGL